MPDVHTHRVQAAHNRKVADALLNDGHRDWAVIACFYSALHHVDAILASTGGPQALCHPRRHEAREKAMAYMSSVFPQDVFDAYMKLKQGSENARYRCISPTQAQMQTIYLPQLEIIEQFLDQKLGPL